MPLAVKICGLSTRETLDAALAALVGAPVPSQTIADAPVTSATTATTTTTSADTAIASLTRRASDHYDRARAAQRNEDWTTYGEEMKKLGEVLRQLKGRP